MSKVTNKQLVTKAFMVHGMVIEYMGALEADGLYVGASRAFKAGLKLSDVHEALGERPADYTAAVVALRFAQSYVAAVKVDVDADEYVKHAKTRHLLVTHLWDLEDDAQALEAERERRKAAKQRKPRALFRGSDDTTQAIADALNGTLK